MIQFNLLPDVKMEYIKTRHMKRLVMLISLATAAVSIAVFVIMFITVQVAQKKHLDDVSKDIKTQMSKLQGVEDLDKILTIQNQLNSLPDLHDKKPVTSRLFGYIQQVTPVTATMSSLSLDLTTNSVTIDGKADTLATVNKFADTLKFATLKTAADQSGAAKPFSNVVTTLSQSDKGATYSLIFNFDPILFAFTDTPTISVPKIISTRSETEKPSAVFKANPTPTPTKAGN